MSTSSIITVGQSPLLAPFFLVRPNLEIVDQDERSLRLTEVDLRKIKLRTMLRGKEEDISCQKRLSRFKESNKIPLDARLLQAFWKNPSLIPKAWEPEPGQIITICFDGTRYRDTRANHLFCYPSMYCTDDLVWRYRLNRGRRGVNDLSAVYDEC